MSIIEQAERVKREEAQTLSQQTAVSVMEWGREQRAFRHMVSFNILDEAIEGALEGKTSRAELGNADVVKVVDAVRAWSKPHLVADASLDSLDQAVSKSLHRDLSELSKGVETVVPMDMFRAASPER